MSVIDREIEAAESAFNQLYGVRFDVRDFESGISFYDGMEGSEAKMNDFYKETFVTLYKNIFANFIDRKIGKTLDVGNVLRDFEKIISPLRRRLEKAEIDTPAKYGGWSTTDFLGAMKNAVEDVPNDTSEYAVSRYKSGKLDISEIKDYLNQLKNEEKPSTEKLSTLYAYRAALSSVVGKRPFGWILGNLYQFFAERSALKNINAYLVKETKGELRENSGNEKFNEILKQVKSPIIEQNKAAVSNAYLEAGGEPEKKDESLLKEKVFVDDALVGDPSPNLGDISVVSTASKGPIDFN